MSNTRRQPDPRSDPESGFIDDVSAVKADHRGGTLDQSLRICAGCERLHAGEPALGLVMPEEIVDLQQKLMELAEILEKSVDIDGLLELAEHAEELRCRNPRLLIIPGEK